MLHGERYVKSLHVENNPDVSDDVKALVLAVQWHEQIEGVRTLAERARRRDAWRTGEGTSLRAVEDLGCD